MARLIVATGVPASGKSAVAQELAQRSARSVVVDGDVIRDMVINGQAHMSPDPSESRGRNCVCGTGRRLSVVEVYPEAGFDVVFNDNVLGPIRASRQAPSSTSLS